MPGFALRLRGVALILGLIGTVLAAQPGHAQTAPPTIGPAVSEQRLLDELQRIQGRVSIPDQRSATLIQPQGRDWRAFRTQALPWIGGVAILGMASLLGVFYGYRGRVRIEQGFAGQTIQRFSAFERFIHWLTAVCFIILAISGLNISFGRELLLPLMGPEAFTAFSQWGKYAHNYLSFPFMFGITFMLFLWVRDNVPTRLDLEWLRKGGGMVGSEHPLARRFNAGQKGIFWAVVLGGAAVSASGLVLMFPFYVTDVAGQQTAQIVHAIIGVLMIAVILAHIYIGSIGMQGAFDAMGKGQVDLNWAKEHHALWVEEEGRKARAEKPETALRPGPIPAQ